jgi:two-component system, NtrC family, sensor kinase
MNKQQLYSILDAITDGVIIIKHDHSIEFMNQAMIDIFGPANDQKCYQVIYCQTERCTYCQAELIIHSGQSVTREAYLKHLGKSFEIREFPMDQANGSVSLVARYQDISKAKQDEKKLRASQKDYRSLFEHAACGVFISSKEGKFEDVNKTMMNILGYNDKDELLKKDIARDIYFNPKDRLNFREMIERDGKVVDYEVYFKHKDGHAVPVMLTGHVRYDENGKVIGYEGLNVDQTPKKQMENELEKTRMQLLQSEKMASLGKLSAGVAHQLNNPLSGITLYSQLIMEDYELTEEAREDFKRVIANVQRCNDIVKQLLQFSRQTNRRIELIDINDSILKTIELLEKQVLFQNIKIVTKLASDLYKINVDNQQMTHVFINIIINAADAMEGRGKLTIKSQNHETDENIIIQISDTGSGIKPDIINNIFDPFFTTKEEGKGTGLGLSMAYGIVENHGGKIKVTSKARKGATFTIELPVTSQFDSKNATSEFI